jgi:hypothetical protein
MGEQDLEKGPEQYNMGEQDLEKGPVQYNMGEQDLEKGNGLEKPTWVENWKICLIISTVVISSLIVVPMFLMVNCGNEREYHLNQCIIKGREIPLLIKNNPEQASALNDEVVFWNSSILYYVVDADLPLNTKKIVTQAIDEYLLYTNITLIEYQGDMGDTFSYVIITSENTGLCSSFVGKQIGWQKLYMGHKCSKKDGIHEIMHALGWSHEQNRLDRDQYLTIHFDNIIPKKIHNFDIKPNSLYDKIESHTKFDFDSIMLYSRHAFSKNGLVTTDYPKNKDIAKFSFSKTDLEELQLYYLLA